VARAKGGAARSFEYQYFKQLRTPAVLIKGGQVLLNPAAQRLLSCSDNGPTPFDQWLQHLFEERAHYVHAFWRIQSRIGGSHPLTLPVRRYDGRRLWLQLIILPFGGGNVWMLTDLTSQFESLEHLALFEARWQALVENLPGWVTELGLDGTIRWISKQPLGRKTEEVVGRSFWEFIGESAKDDANEAFEMLREGARTVQLRTDEILPDGQHVYFVHHVAQVVKDGQPAGYVVHTVDVTLFQEREQLIRDQARQLYEARAVEAVVQIARGIAHDLNNLLCALQGSLEFARRQLADDHPAREDLADMQTTIDRITAHVGYLLAAAKGGKPQPVRLNLNGLLTDFTRVLRWQLGSQVQLKLVLGPDVPHVLAPPGRLEQVVANLAVNARDAMAQGGILVISTERMAMPAVLTVSNTVIPAGEYAAVAVKDNGGGIPPEIQARIFEPFFTTKEPGKGSGLGLAVVKSIVEELRGYLWLESEPGVGTTFRILLPAAK